MEYIARQAPLSMGFSRQEQWSGLPFPSPIHEKWKWSCSVDLTDCSPPGSSVHGIFQARVLEWVAIAFSITMVKCCLRRWVGLRSKHRASFGKIPTTAWNNHWSFLQTPDGSRRMSDDKIITAKWEKEKVWGEIGRHSHDGVWWSYPETSHR